MLCTNGKKKSNKNYLSKNYKLNTHKNICDSLSYSIRIRNGPAENHTGSPWLGDSRATNNNMKARTTNFFLDPKQLSLIICNTDNSVSKVVFLLMVLLKHSGHLTEGYNAFPSLLRNHSQIQKARFQALQMLLLN